VKKTLFEFFLFFKRDNRKCLVSKSGKMNKRRLEWEVPLLIGSSGWIGYNCGPSCGAVIKVSPLLNTSICQWPTNDQRELPQSSRLSFCLSLRLDWHILWMKLKFPFVLDLFANTVNAYEPAIIFIVTTQVCYGVSKNKCSVILYSILLYSVYIIFRIHYILFYSILF
jgi:hypothetical protein